MKTFLRPAALILLFLLTLPATGEELGIAGVHVDPAPGYYAEDTTVSLTGSEFLEYRFKESDGDGFTPYTVPFRLTALTGEERTYTLVLKEKDGQKQVTFVIDKKGPQPAVPDPRPGYYSGEVQVSFAGGRGDRIFADVDKLPTDLVPDRGITLRQDRLEDRTYTIYAYARDQAGNTGPVESYTYTIRRRQRAESFMRVKSPVPGTFLNPQLLVCDHNGFSWIRYSTDGREPAEYGELYTKPVLLNKTGSVRVRLAAQPEGGGEVVTTEILYNVVDGAEQIDFPPQGIYAEALNLPALTDNFLFTLNDNIPEEDAGTFDRSLKLIPVPGTMKVYTLRLAGSGRDGAYTGTYRYVYCIDSGTPEKPRITLSHDSPVSQDVEVTITSEAWNDIYYSTDGRTPDARSTPYRGPFTVSLPENLGFGSIIIKAIVYGVNGLKSSEASYLITFDKEPPDPPEVTITGPLDNGAYRCDVEGEYGSRIVYEISYDNSEPPPPAVDSPVFGASRLFTLPYGMDANILLRCAAVDEAGNISASTDVYSFHIDRIPPPPPKLTLDKDGLVIEAASKVYYRLFRTDRSISSETEQRFRVYEETVPLEDGSSAAYRVEAYTQDDAGNRSLTVSESYSRRKEGIEPPVFYGLEEKKLFNTDTVAIRVSPASADHTVRYSYTTDGTEPPEPGVQSPEAEGVLSFECPPDTEKHVRFSLASFSADGSERSETVGSSFTIDRLSPGVPVLQGFENGGVYNSAVTFRATAEDGDRIFYSMSTERAIPPDPFGPEGAPLPETYTILPEEGQEREYRIRLASVDRAGNRTLNETIYSVTIDREFPLLPEPLGLPPEGITTGNVHVSFPPFDGRILYTLSRDGTVPPEPDEDSNEYGEHIVLHGEPGKEITYILRTSCIDRAGNKSTSSKVYHCVIDQKAPEPPAEPKLDVANDRTTLIVSWPEEQEGSVIFKIPDISNTWYAYDNPVSFSLPPTLNRLSLEYYSRDSAGNNSNRRTITVELPFSSSTPLFTGIDDGKIYNSSVRLYKSAGSSLCRYEVGINEDSPPSVNSFSPVLPDSLTFDAVEGETVRYSLRVRLFPDGDGRGVQREQTASIIIDRDPPPPPNIDGIKDGVFYQDDRTISFQSREGRVRYSVTREGEEASEPDNFLDYTRPVALQTEEGTLATYSISAYTVDEAGNRSPVQTWNISIDKEMIYVAEGGNDGYDGTRTHPFRTIRKAVEHSKQTGRLAIYIAGGYYPLNRTVDLPAGVVLTGGYSETTWNRSAEGETVCIPGTFFTGNQPMFRIKDGKISLKNIRVYDTSGLSSALLSVEGGEGNVSGTVLERTGSKQGSIISQTSGVLYINNSSLKVSRSSGTNALAISGGTAFISDSSIRGSNTEGTMTLITLRGKSRVLAGRSTFAPGDGTKTGSFYAEESSIVLTDCNVSTGNGAISGYAFHLKDSTLECAASSISGEPDSRLTTTVISESSEVNLYNTLLKAVARQGAVGIRASDSVVNVANSAIEGGSSAEFTYLFRLDGGYGYFFTNHMTGETTGDFAVMRITNGNVKWYSNSCRFSGGEEHSTCFDVSGNSFMSIANSIMIQTGRSLDGAFYRSNTVENLECLANNIYGWGIVAETDETILADVDLLNTADENPLGGSLHGNLAEHPSETFTVSKSEPFRLLESSTCVNNGFDVRPLGGADRDWDGQSRPNPYHGIKPAFDIGADEFYE